MKKEIVYTDKYALILSDERIEDVRPHKGKFHLEQGLIINKFPTYLTDLTECKLIIAHLPLSDAPILKGVPLLPSFSWGQQDDVDTDMFYHKQVMNPYPTDSQSFTSYEKGFIAGYNKAKEKYRYTEEDVIKIVEKSRETGLTAEYLMLSLQQPPRPTHFECEMVQLSSNESFGLDYGSSNLKPKTITNSQGQVELVGKYI
jgi:hypothetical protein